jgi:uncharacterized protein YycO
MAMLKATAEIKKTLFILGILGLTLCSGLYGYSRIFNSNDNLEHARKEVQKLADQDEIQSGDIIFQTSLSEQSKAIQLATKSEYSHCGIIFKEGNDYYVFEAIQPVKRTPLDKWIARGKNGEYVIKRLNNAEQVLTPTTIAKMKQVGEEFRGKNYDLTFEWSDDKIYCSELIWKIYQRATGIEIGKLEKLSDFDLTSDAVKKKMNERYGNKIPLNEIVISPASIFNSELLVTVKSN